MSFVTRFAPSPTGRLHLGHALSALTVWRAAEAAGGTALLRIEDIDHTRARPELVRGILDDLRWLGLSWPEPVWYQSQRVAAYQAALEELKQRGLVYPCYCTRREIQEAASEVGFEGPIYPGTCRDLKGAGPEDLTPAWRLNLSRALAETGTVHWRDEEAGPQQWDGTGWGDVILARRDIGTSYHLAVSLDDAAQGITHVIRGQDLFTATHIHVVLQKLLGLPQPVYRHHRLLTGGEGAKLSKSKGAQSLRDLIESGASRDDVRALIDRDSATNGT